MFEKLSYLMLQQYWWLIIAILAALFIFMTFVQGGQTLLYSLGKNEKERDLIINSLGRKWELGFSALVMFGGALFAAFPLFYATSFGGAYYVWMAILFCFIIQAVAYEYRKKPDNVFGEKTYELFLIINGSLGIILIGIALGTLFTGGNFIVNDMNLSHWTQKSYGLEAIFNFYNLAFGFMIFFLARIQASLYFINSIENREITNRAKIVLKYETWIFLILFAYVVFSLLTMSGFNYDVQTKIINIENQKFLHNLIAMPIVAGMIGIGALSLLWGIASTFWTKSERGIWFSGFGTISVVIGLVLILGYNHTAFYPSLADLQSSLTIENSSSSRYTLVTMSYVSLMVPFVLAYITWAWRVMNRDKITMDEVQDDAHHY